MNRWRDTVPAGLTPSERTSMMGEQTANHIR